MYHIGSIKPSRAKLSFFNVNCKSALSHLIQGALLRCSKRLGLPHWESESGEAGAVDDEGLFRGFRFSKDFKGAERRGEGEFQGVGVTPGGGRGPHTLRILASFKRLKLKLKKS